MKLTLRDKVAPLQTAVLVIDKQNDIFDEQGALNQKLGWDAAPIRAISDPLDQFITEARSAGLHICYSQMVNGDQSPANLVERLSSGSEAGAGEWPYALKKDSWGYDIYGQQPAPTDQQLDKWSFDFFTTPELKEYLARNEIRNLIVTGAYSHICVPTTATRGFSEGYHVVLPQDLIATTREKTAAAKIILSEGDQLFYELADSQNIANTW